MTKILSIFPQSAINFIMSTPLLNNIFSFVIRKSLGLNKSRICITGAASIPISTLEWFNRFKIKYMKHTECQKILHAHTETIR